MPKQKVNKRERRKEMSKNFRNTLERKYQYQLNNVSNEALKELKEREGMFQKLKNQIKKLFKYNKTYCIKCNRLISEELLSRGVWQGLCKNCFILTELKKKEREVNKFE